LAVLLLALSDFLDPSRGPDQRGGFRVSPTIFLLMVVGGFVIGTIGHVIRSRALVVVGIAMIFLATLFIPIALSLSR
jgi:hypothetical protein